MKFVHSGYMNKTISRFADNSDEIASVAPTSICKICDALIFLSDLSPIWETQRFWQFCNQSVQQKGVADEKQAEKIAP